MVLRLPVKFRFTRTQLLQLWYVPVLGLAMGLMLMRLLVMARILDLSSFATYSAGLLVSSSFLMLGCLGLQSLLQRDLPMLIVRHREYAGGVLLMQCALVATACLVLGAAAVLVSGISLAGLSPALLVLALIHGLSLQLFLVATVDSRSRGQPLRFAQQNLSRALITLIASVSVATLGGGAAAVLATEAASSMLLAAWLYRQQLYAIPLKLTAAVTLAWRRLPLTPWRSAFALLGVASLSFLVINADRWLAAQQLTGTAFAQYSFAWTVLMVAQSVQVLINASLFPLLARCFASRGGLIAFDTTVKASLGFLACGAIIVLPLWVLLDYFISMWFTAYQEARNLLPVFLLVSVLRMSDFWTSYLLVIGQEARLLILNLLSVPIATVGWIVFIQADADQLRIEQVAWLALLLAAAGYFTTAWAAWHYSKEFRKIAA